MSKPTREQIEVALQFADQRPLPSGHVYAATLAAGLRATEAENRRLREQLKECNESHTHPRIIEDRSADISFNDEWEGEDE